MYCREESFSTLSIVLLPKVMTLGSLLPLNLPTENLITFHKNAVGNHRTVKRTVIKNPHLLIKGKTQRFTSNNISCAPGTIPSASHI